MSLITVILDATGLTKEQRIFIVRVGWVGFVSIHIAWVCGWLTPLGLETPFAHSNTLTMLVNIVNSERVERIDRDIQTVRAQQCRTPIDSPARQNYTDRLNDLIGKYVYFTRVQPRVPHCDET